MLAPSSALLQSYINKVESLMLSLEEMTTRKEQIEQELEAVTKRAEDAEHELMFLKRELHEEGE